MSVVWVHTPSVGEYNTVKPLLEWLKNGNHKLVITYSSPRAEEFMKKQTLGEKYLRLPFSGLLLGFAPQWVVKKYKPKLFLLVESDRYPSLLGVKAPKKALINARLSPKSYKFLKALRGIYRPLLSSFDAIVCKDADTEKLFTRLGIPKERLKTCGNLKAVFRPNLGEFNLKFPSTKRIFTVGSTHEGEEKTLLSAFGEIKRSFPQAVLVIAPRHVARAREVLNLARRTFPNLKTSPRSTVKGTFEGDILIVDTLGELLHFYRLSEVSFVGGSLVPIGGHNLLEPAYFGKPVLYGPHVGKFKDLEKLLKELGLAYPVKGAKDIAETVKRLFQNPPRPKGDLKEISEKTLECYKREIESLLRDS